MMTDINPLDNRLLYNKQEELQSNEGLRIVCKGLGLETNPRYPWDLFINVRVLTYRVFQNVDISSYSKTTRVTSSNE